MIDLNTLDPKFAELVHKTLLACTAQNLNMVPYFGIRDPTTQGIFWRQSRPTATVKVQIETLKVAGAPYLATCLDRAGPHSGPWATNALPGQSWHQYGEAVDCYALDDVGQIDWNSAVKYREYGRIAKLNGLRWGGDFQQTDPGHIQLRSLEPPQLFPIATADKILSKKFPLT